MAQNRVGGILFLKINGVQYRAKGNFSYNIGKPKREAVVGADGVHGYKEMPQTSFIEGEITDGKDLDLAALVTMDNVTATLEISNGKVIAVYEGWYAGEGTGNTEEGNIGLRIEGLRGEEVK